jgi:hypothetical protein
VQKPAYIGVAEIPPGLAVVEKVRVGHMVEAVVVDLR